MTKPIAHGGGGHATGSRPVTSPVTRHITKIEHWWNEELERLQWWVWEGYTVLAKFDEYEDAEDFVNNK
jgi:hypothetical protein